MADRVIFLGWSNAVRGRERASADVFAEAMEFWGRLRAEGEIESVEAVLLDAHGGDLGGFFLVKGDAVKLALLRLNPEFQRIMVRANTIVEGLGAVGGVTGESLTRQMELFTEAADDLG
jgi:hypothetical protein